jgi:hypothetical protein
MSRRSNRASKAGKRTMSASARRKIAAANPEKVHSFINSNLRQGFCDDCVERKTGVNRHEVNTIASTLAPFPKEFSRVSIPCPQKCAHRDKLVTMSLSRSKLSEMSNMPAGDGPDGEE